jgi:hypothetical protein
MHSLSYDRPLVYSAALALGASLSGLSALPAIIGRSPGRVEAGLWLGGVVVACVCLIAATRPLSAALATGLARLPGRGGHRVANAHLPQQIARLAIAAAYLLVAQAMLRRPLVALLGLDGDPFVVEAVFAAVAALLLLVLLGWLYRVARPIVEALAWFALDSTLATSGSEVASTENS